MGRLVRKILCPAHEERNPSCGVYDDGSGYCFSCGKYFSNISEPLPNVSGSQVTVEDIDEKIKYIQTLPKAEIRGLEFPFDNTGYYILWPDHSYYLCRIWVGDSRYSSPHGIQRPWFYDIRINRFNSSGHRLVIVEGEINALSIRQVMPELEIISPGSASNFYNSYTRQRISELGKYQKIVLIADKDKAGFEAVYRLRELLIPYCQNITLKLMEEDCNDLLTKYGQERLKEELKALDV